MAKLNKNRCTVIVGAILIAAGGALTGAATDAATGPATDAQIRGLLQEAAQAPAEQYCQARDAVVKAAREKDVLAAVTRLGADKETPLKLRLMARICALRAGDPRKVTAFYGDLSAVAATIMTDRRVWMNRLGPEGFLAGQVPSMALGLGRGLEAPGGLGTLGTDESQKKVKRLLSADVALFAECLIWHTEAGLRKELRLAPGWGRPEPKGRVRRPPGPTWVARLCARWFLVVQHKTESVHTLEMWAKHDKAMRPLAMSDLKWIVRRTDKDLSVRQEALLAYGRVEAMAERSGDKALRPVAGEAVRRIKGAAFVPSTAKRPTPRKDQKIADLLQAGKKDDAFMRELAQMDRRRLTRALAWELTRPELRAPALRFLGRKGSYGELAPYVVVAMKWGTGADRLTAMYVVMRYRTKEAVPVILTHILDDPYMEVRHIRRDDTGKIYRSEITADLGRWASLALAMLTDGKIGLKPRPGEPPPRRMGAAWPAVPNEQKRQWRAWWKKNGKNLLPQVAMPQARFQTEKEVRQWCQARIGFFGEEMAKAARKDVDAFLRAVSWLGKTGGDLFGVNIPPTVIGPVRTAVLVVAALDSSAKGAKRTGAGRARHRLALLALSRSVDYPEITSLLLWAHKNGRVLDMQAEAYCLGEMRDARTVGLLEKILNEKPDRATRFDVARALGKTNQPAAAKLLVQVLATDKSDRFSQTIYEALRGLARRGPAQEKAVVEAVGPLLADPDAKVVKLALGVLANTSSTAALAAVEKAMPKLDAELKIRAKRILELIRNNIARGGTTPPGKANS